MILKSSRRALRISIHWSVSVVQDFAWFLWKTFFISEPIDGEIHHHLA